jgi:hypothetical protein
MLSFMAFKIQKTIFSIFIILKNESLSLVNTVRVRTL